MRIRPSQSTVMNRKVGSTTSFTTVRFETIALGNRAPNSEHRRRQADPRPCDVRAADRIHIEHTAEIAYVSIEKVMPVRGSGAPGLFVRNSLHALKPAFQKHIGPGFDPSGDFGIGRPAVGRVVLEAAIVRRIVRRRDDNAVRQPCTVRPRL